jgi:hypothetical protein
LPPFSLVSIHGLGQQRLGLPLQDRVEGEAERVPNAQFLAHIVHG